MEANWEKSINFVLDMEGRAFEDNPSDPGGKTKFGISQKAFPDLDIENLTQDDAEKIYREQYWLPCQCDKLLWPWDVMILDMAVNQGTGTAVKLLQKTLEMPQDGIIGPHTLQAVNCTSIRERKVFLAQRLAAYARLMAEKQNLLEFALDWSFRVISLQEFIDKNGGEN